MTQNSTPSETIRPEDLQKELNIKKDTYYADLKYLNIDADKDSEGKAFLTFEQAEQIRALRNHVAKCGKRGGFSNSSIVKVDDSNLTTSPSSNSEEDIYIEPEEPTAQLDLARIKRKAQELKAREIATPDLIIRELANRMEEGDLDDDLREKLSAVRESTSPKWTPAQIADNILATHRSSLRGN